MFLIAGESNELVDKSNVGATGPAIAVSAKKPAKETPFTLRDYTTARPHDRATRSTSLVCLSFKHW